MTEITKNNMKKNTLEETRIRRRKLLKAGVVIAPLAITLHGGIPLAHAGSTGACLEGLEKNIKIPNFKVDVDDEDGDGDYGDYVLNGKIEHFDHDRISGTGKGTTGRTNSNGSQETHWDYLKNENSYGASCLQSIENSGDDEHEHEDYHDYDNP